MTPDDFRELVLALDGAVEGAHMGHPDFRANGRIFASLHTRDASGLERFAMVKLEPAEQQVFRREHPAMFEPSAGAWGRQGCTNVRLEAATRPPVRSALRLAWTAAVAKPPAKPGRPGPDSRQGAKAAPAKARPRSRS